MAVKQKPKTPPKDVMAVIQKGGGVPSKEVFKTLKRQDVRLDSKLIARIDQLRDKRIIPTSRHSWILEAILEKLERDE